MGRRERVERTAEEKWGIVQEGIKSGNDSQLTSTGHSCKVIVLEMH